MGEPVNVVRMTISVPRDLKARMDEVAEKVNWSATATKAFEHELLALQSQRKGESMDEVIARMKAAAEIESNEAYQEGFKAGQEWAKEDATPKQLRRLDAYIKKFEPNRLPWWGVDSHGVHWNAPWGATGYFALAVMGLDSGEADRNADSDFWAEALGGLAHKINDADFFHGFGDGALDVWKKVRDKL